MSEMVKKSYLSCPSACYYVAFRVLTAYQRMRVEERLYYEKTRHLVLIMTKCAIRKVLLLYNDTLTGTWGVLYQNK